MSTPSSGQPFLDVLAARGSRRAFLRAGAFSAAAVSAVACHPSSGGTSAKHGEPDLDAHRGDASGGTAAPIPAPPTAASIRAAADAMDAMHERGMKAFPANTEGRGNQLLEPRIEHGVKVYDLTCTKVQWEVEPGRRVEAWTYNGTVPGPQIRVREGDRVRVHVKNELTQSTAVHFHGVEVPNAVDGVPFITQPPIKPGETYTYEFTAPNPGSHMYHSHHNSTTQVGLGMLGAFIIEPNDRTQEPHVHLDYVMVLNDGAHGYTLNGKSFPATEPLTATLGHTVRIRFMNEGMMIHPMHLHGMHMTVITKDGWPVPTPWKCDTLCIAPGERWDVLVHCTNPGTWAFHCHILPHAESEQGMFGMVTALVVS